MPTRTELEDAEPLTDSDAALLLAYLRGSSFYLLNSWAFSNLAALLEERVGDDTPKGLLLSAVLTKLDALGDGTVGVKGGRFGADYQQARDRDQLCILALSTLYDFSALGIVIGPDGQPLNPGDALSGGKRGGAICDEVMMLLPRT